MTVRHKCFIAYHHADQGALDQFLKDFGGTSGTFIHRGISMAEDIINSEDVDYVMSRIRTLYLQDSTVTIVLQGHCTWARKFVDWEVQASLRQPKDGLPNGLIAILEPGRERSSLPDRVKLNVESKYATYYKYPAKSADLARWIDDAFDARTSRANLIKNPRDRYAINRPC